MLECIVRILIRRDSSQLSQLADSERIVVNYNYPPETAS